MNRQLHHYAPTALTPKIHANKVLLPSNFGLPETRPMVWFSSNQAWEESSEKCVRGDEHEFFRMQQKQKEMMILGCCRFSLPNNDPRVLAWKEACRFAGIDYALRRQLEKVGRKLGAKPSEQWFAIADAVSIDELQFSFFGSSGWYPSDVSEYIPMGIHGGPAKLWMPETPFGLA